MAQPDRKQRLTPTKPNQKAGAHLAGAIEEFLLSRRVGNCSPRKALRRTAILKQTEDLEFVR